MKRLLIVILLLAGVAPAEDIRVATYNIENFREHFLAHKITQNRPSWLPRDKDDPLAKEIMDELRYANDEDNWEISQVILDPHFFPDVLVIQEGCGQSDLDYFNKRWLQGKYAAGIVFPSNTERNQNLCLLLKPGFRILQRKDQYYLEKDSAGANERGDRLFARGPVFVEIESPSGYRFWVGTNHQKSKSGNNAEVTAWRNREAKRTHQIIKELEKAGPDDVIFLGDMNDELGIQEYELEGGGDVIANLVGPPSDGLILATRPLIDAGKISFGGYSRADHRSFIDQIVVTASVKDQIKDVQVFENDFTKVASDHFPVMLTIQADAPAPAAP